MVRDSATRLRIPPDSSAGYLSQAFPRPTSCNNCLARTKPSSGVRPANVAPKATFSKAVFHGKRASDWNKKPIPGGTDVTKLPFTETLPEVAGKSPETKRNRVLLPQPLGPMMATNSPLAMSKETLLRAKLERALADAPAYRSDTSSS